METVDSVVVVDPFWFLKEARRITLRTFFPVLFAKVTVGPSFAGAGADAAAGVAVGAG